MVSKVLFSMIEWFLFHSGHSSILFPKYGICIWMTKIVDIPIKFFEINARSSTVLKLITVRFFSKTCGKGKQDACPLKTTSYGNRFSCWKLTMTSAVSKAQCSPCQSTAWRRARGKDVLCEIKDKLPVCGR